MTMRQAHWDSVYAARKEEDLTWFEALPSLSYDLVVEHLRPEDAFIDVGGGKSRLVDMLIDHGFTNLTVLDVSPAALEATRNRLGRKGDAVSWIVADITKWQPPQTYAVWHDRAVFHFLTDSEDRQSYVRIMGQAVAESGVAIIATFAEDGPEMCSGLPVVRYSSEELAQLVASLSHGQFKAIRTRRHIHVTPKGNRQSFQYSVLRKVVSDPQPLPE